MNKDSVNKKLEEIFPAKTVVEWGTRFDQFGVPWAPVNTIDKALSDPQVLARNMVVEVKHPVDGSYKSVGNPIKASDTVEEFKPVPLMGQHTRQIMSDVLKYDPVHIDQLFAEGVVSEQTPQSLEEACRLLESVRDLYAEQLKKKD